MAHRTTRRRPDHSKAEKLGKVVSVMLHYPHYEIPEERFAWIYPLARKLEPKARIYLWEDRQQDTKCTWQARLEAKQLQQRGDGEALESLCKPILTQYPLMHSFFSFLIDAYMIQNRLQYAEELVLKRKQLLIAHPYKVLGRYAVEIGFEGEEITMKPFGYVYKIEMGDWISALRTLQFYEIDTQKKIREGFVFKQRKPK